MSFASPRTLAAAAAITLVLAPTFGRADGLPVYSLEPMPLGRTGVMIYSDRASPVLSFPVRRVVTNGENTDIEYDLSAAPQMVVSCPNPRIVGSGENATSECDTASSARASHSMPNVGGGHNAALWNLRSLPPSVR